MILKVKIDNVVYDVLQSSINIRHYAAGTIDTASFTIYDPTNAITIVAGKDCIIENAADANDRKFGGIIMEIEESTKGLGREFNCTALGWEILLEKATANGTFRGRSDADIINLTPAPLGSDKGIFHKNTTSSDLTAFDITTNVSVGIINTQFLQFKSETIRNILDTLAEMAGFVWYIDPFKKLFYKAFGVDGHSFRLSDNPDNIETFPYRDMKRVIDIYKVVNEIIVEGGNKRLVAQTKAYGANGNDKTFEVEQFVPLSGDLKITVEKNTGTEGSPTWTNQTVGLKGFDILPTVDVLWTPVTRRLEFNTAPGNFATNSYRVKGDILVRMKHIEQDESSIAKLGQIFSVKIYDPALTSDKQVELRAQAELRKRKGQYEKVIIFCDKDGITAGKIITLTNVILGISNKVYLVESTEMRLLGAELFEYKLTLSDF